ncbi:phosphoprotein [Black currant nucleorhabdovirus 1]|uniref:Phosphoprotein n=1 Tax=Black currant nucleorhabdovirus 1 TaxID=2079521 RepID=A0A2K9YRH5_9RHAB|nr:phosphoprotein [Black currant nucleorhabdovirus 1]AUW36415.1 phosphoprotein [Black currant nucleorhabdovirus 1]
MNIAGGIANVHGPYSGLPQSALNSEVLTSRLANEVVKSDTIDDEERTIAYMKEWMKTMSDKGINIPTRVIEVLAEISIVLENSGMDDLHGKFGFAMVEFGTHLMKNQIAPNTLLEKMTGLVDKLYEGVNEMKKTNDKINQDLPRTIAKAKRQQSGKAKASETSPEKVNNNNLSPPSTAQSNTDTGVKEQEEKMETDAPALNPKSEKAKQLRDTYKAHYSTPGFDAYTPEKVRELITYYARHILDIRPDIWQDDASTFNMVSDLIDKKRLFIVLSKAKDMGLSYEDHATAREEFIDAINTCSPAYGSYTVQGMIHGDDVWIELIKLD